MGTGEWPKGLGTSRIGPHIGSGSGGSSLHSSEICPLIPENKEVRKHLNMVNIFLTSSHIQPLQIGHLWYLHVHCKELFIWICCHTILFSTQQQLSWVEPAAGRQSTIFSTAMKFVCHLHHSIGMHGVTLGASLHRTR